jgi:outer membrane murein-binding lipoprotein Lpp
MKHVFSILIAVIVLAGCSNHAKDEAVIKQQVIVALKDSLKLDSFKKAEAKEKEVAAIKAEKEKIAAQVKEERKTMLLSERTDAAPQPRQDVASSPAKKKGWSAAAKGTAIGAGAGALGGILLDKKDGRGAIIGGVVGAGTGYLIGRDQDRKSGRVKPKN